MCSVRRPPACKHALVRVDTASEPHRSAGLEPVLATVPLGSAFTASFVAPVSLSPLSCLRSLPWQVWRDSRALIACAHFSCVGERGSSLLFFACVRVSALARCGAVSASAPRLLLLLLLFVLAVLLLVFSLRGRRAGRAAGSTLATTCESRTPGRARRAACRGRVSRAWAVSATHLPRPWACRPRKQRAARGVSRIAVLTGRHWLP